MKSFEEVEEHLVANLPDELINWWSENCDPAGAFAAGFWEYQKIQIDKLKKELKAEKHNTNMWKGAAHGWHNFYEEIYCELPNSNKQYAAPIKDWKK